MARRFRNMNQDDLGTKWSWPLLRMYRQHETTGSDVNCQDKQSQSGRQALQSVELTGPDHLKQHQNFLSAVTASLDDLYTDMVKEKVKLSLCLINEAPCHDDVWEIGAIVPPFLTSALGGEWSSSRPGSINPTERAPSINSIGGRVSARTSVDAV
jgi:hypothetical protein